MSKYSGHSGCSEIWVGRHGAYNLSGRHETFSTRLVLALGVLSQHLRLPLQQCCTGRFLMTRTARHMAAGKSHDFNQGKEGSAQAPGPVKCYSSGLTPGDVSYHATNLPVQHVSPEP